MLSVAFQVLMHFSLAMAVPFTLVAMLATFLLLSRVIPVKDAVYAGLIVGLMVGFMFYRWHLIDLGEKLTHAAVAAAILKQQKIADQAAADYQKRADARAAEVRAGVKEKRVLVKIPVNQSCDLAPDVVQSLNAHIAGTN